MSKMPLPPVLRRLATRPLPSPSPKDYTISIYICTAHFNPKGLHLMHGIPKIAVENKLPILGTNFTADMLVGAEPRCQSFIPDHWAIDTDHPGAQAYYDSIVKLWSSWDIDVR